jgi:predicted dehydrogenase
MHKIAFIGTGGRSVSYATAYQKRDDVEITGLADPDATHRRTLAQRSDLANPYAEYDDWRDMLREQQDLDGVVICSPNHLHAEHAVACLERGLPIALEKPLASNQEDCQRIIEAESANDGRTLIGFVLRSSPFYAKIHQLVSRGLIGRIVSIQADELPGVSVTSIMNRSPWRRYKAQSGGSMLEKSCHDLDLLNWMMDCAPISLNAYGGRQIFVTDPELPEHCDECHLQTACSYYRPTRSEHEDQGEELLHQFIREDQSCIYNIDKDILDVQSLNIEYENGAMANFMLNFHAMGPQAGRNFHAVGTQGRIWGNLHDAQVHLYRNGPGTEEIFDGSGDGSGHGGGDALHAYELVAMMEDPEYRPRQNAHAGYLSAMMCFAADTSVEEKRRIDFRFNPAGEIRFD